MNLIQNKVPREYLQGFVDFSDCKIDLSKKPFIPRIETEFWVKRAIRDIKRKAGNSKRQRTLTVLDIFAGSGCIGIMILKSIPDSFVDFIDTDQMALLQIRINLEKNKISHQRYRIIKSNVFKSLLTPKPRRGPRDLYDYIFANPPYIARKRIREVNRATLRYEPKGALFGGNDGLFYIKKFLRQAKNFLKKKSIIYLEIDHSQKDKIKNLLKRYKYSDSTFYKDQFGKYRWIKISNI